MAALSLGANWLTVADLEPATNKLHGAIDQILKTANFKHLENVALSSRDAQIAGDGSAISCTLITERFTFGMNNVAFRLTFSDGVAWIARVCHSAISGSDHGEEATKDMLSEIATIRTLRRQTTIPVPDVFAFQTSATRDFAYPYMLMECLRGQTLGSTAARAAPAEYHAHIAKQFADVLFQLQNLSFDTLGRLWCGESGTEPVQIIPNQYSSRPATSLECFYKDRQNQNRKVLESHAQDPEWRTACWVLKSAVPHIIIEDRIYGPFPLCHADLHYGNLLFDENYDLTGVLDWSGAGTAPLERLAVSPEFITFPGMADEENAIILNFRNAVRNHLRELENRAQAFTYCASSKTRLSAVLGTARADIAYRCTYSFPHRALYDGQLVAELIYKGKVSWEQLVAVYGEFDVY